MQFPAIYADNWAGPQTYFSGLDVLESGWLGIFDGDIGWYANISLFAGFALCCTPKAKWSWILFSFGLLVALTSFGVSIVWYNEGNYSPVKGLGVGFYIWLANFIMLSLGFGIVHLMSNEKG